jgi:hypothetical protein
VTVQSTGASVLLQAGDNLDLQAGSTVQAATTITGTSDFGDADPGVGTLINVLGILGGASASFAGGNDADLFSIVPSATTAMTIDGNDPIPPATPGDVLDIDTSGTTNPALTSTSTPSGLTGQWTFGNRASIDFGEIETLTAVVISGQ